MADQRRDPDRQQHSAPGGRPSSSSGEAERQQWYRIAGVGFEFIVAVLLFGGIGWWLDSWLGTVPWFLLVGGAFGFALGLWMMVRQAKRAFHD